MSKATRATAALDKAGITHGLHAYDYSAEVESKGVAAAQALGVEPARVFKTLMAWVDKQPVVAVIPCDQRLSLKKLAAACGGVPAVDWAKAGVANWAALSRPASTTWMDRMRMRFSMFRSRLAARRTSRAGGHG